MTEDPGLALDTLYLLSDAPLRTLCVQGDGLLAALIALKLRRVYGKPLTDDHVDRLEQARTLLLGLLGELHADDLRAGGVSVAVDLPRP